MDNPNTKRSIGIGSKLSFASASSSVANYESYKINSIFLIYIIMYYTIYESFLLIVHCSIYHVSMIENTQFYDRHHSIRCHGESILYLWYVKMFYHIPFMKVFLWIGHSLYCTLKSHRLLKYVIALCVMEDQYYVYDIWSYIYRVLFMKLFLLIVHSLYCTLQTHKFLT